MKSGRKKTRNSPIFGFRRRSSRVFVHLPESLLESRGNGSGCPGGAITWTFASEGEELCYVHDGHTNQLRLLHYPPIVAGDVESHLATRLPAHTDWTTLTVVVLKPNLSKREILYKQHLSRELLC